MCGRPLQRRAQGACAGSLRINASLGLRRSAAVEFAFCRPSRRLGRARCPVLLVVPDTDTAVPTGAALRAAKFPRVTVIRSRGGHYDVYPRGSDYEHVITTQLDFLATL